ncbi:hypothetical protein EFM24_09045 [Limosilactobacillus fermentum]|nr:hypothetical protein [Limosilactobacillus fermentum]
MTTSALRVEAFKGGACRLVSGRQSWTIGELSAGQERPYPQVHSSPRRMSGYNKFHLRDTPKNKPPSETNDFLVVYTIDKDELVLIGIRVGSHDRLFPGQNRSKRYRKNNE